MSKFRKTLIVGTVINLSVLALGYVGANMRTVPAGYVGVRVNLYAHKRVDNDEGGVGR